MTLDELKTHLASILAVEERTPVDWARVEFLSDESYSRLTEPGTSQDFPHEEVLGYLAGFNRRQVDEQFGAKQRQWLRNFLRA